VKRKTQRLYFILLGGLALATGVALVLTAFEDSIVFFYSPSDLRQKTSVAGQLIRIGGLVQAGTVEKDGNTVRFTVTDTAENLPIIYRGILPDLFREGQGIVAEGMLLPTGIFQANNIMAKHDENYMPPEVADALKAAGEWRPTTNISEGSGSAMVDAGTP